MLFSVSDRVSPVAAAEAAAKVVHCGFGFFSNGMTFGSLIVGVAATG